MILVDITNYFMYNVIEKIEITQGANYIKIK